MKQYKINEVFMDTEHFNPPKRVKCVADIGLEHCNSDCVYKKDRLCDDIPCCVFNDEIGDDILMSFIETDEPLTEEAK